MDALQGLDVFPLERNPKLKTVFEVRPHRSRLCGDDHLSAPAGCAASDISLDAICPLGCLGPLLPHVQLAVDYHRQVLFQRSAFPRPVVLHGVVVAKVRGPGSLVLLDLFQLASAQRSSLSGSLCRAFLPSSQSTPLPNLASPAGLL